MKKWLKLSTFISIVLLISACSGNSPDPSSEDTDNDGSSSVEGETEREPVTLKVNNPWPDTYPWWFDDDFYEKFPHIEIEWSNHSATI